MKKPTLYTCLSPALLHLYDVRECIVVVIDVLRATSTIATALYNGAKAVIPVDSVEKCIRLGREMECITAGERDGKVAEGLQYGNSSFEYPASFIKGRILVLTTTNGTKLLHIALAKGATEIITGSFLNLSIICGHLMEKKRKVILACAGWKDKVNMEDTLFAGAVVSRIKEHFTVDCDASNMADCLYQQAKDDMYYFLKANNASHYHRLNNYGLDKDIRHCLTPDLANVLPYYVDERLVI
ncbi:MAG: 2-phosphosulfolactate phosphatase [Bacteroidota bacterium]|nr:2-phosphosulfolactate phosphatase [Flavisolibacter sp.]MBD0350047.1 2-phosphosulfolactate phosphatase [Flavisolibacter sp.]MBD0365442.1 2-phosphosulfolactate phosphatase [Flavisolibacter sp.]MDQ3846465.1 2-phosphosulfolactate phosphatase [Bacteroidota bacterium]